jgi:hypothetical protein
MLMLLTTTWNKFYGYILAIGAFVVAVGAIYFKGKSDANKDNERRVLLQDRENRDASDAIRRDVANDGGIADRLRRWERPGG